MSANRFLQGKQAVSFSAHGTSIVMARTVRSLSIALAVAAFCAGVAAADTLPRNRYVYENLARGSGFPAPGYELLGDVVSGQQARVRRHAWDLWAALSAPSRSRWGGQRLPVFETWYSIDEVYNPAGRRGVDRRTLRHPFVAPTQAQIATSSRGGAPAGLMSFVKLNRTAADFIWDNAYYLTPVLEGLNKHFDSAATPVAERSIRPMPPASVALKLVFWLIKNPKSSQSEDGLTALPIWDSAYPPPANGVPPMHTTWTNGVAVDPTNRIAEGTLRRVNVNGTVAAPNYVLAPVVSLRRFYAHRLNDAQAVADAKVYMDMMSSAAGEQERMVTNAGQTPELGDYVVLLGMHVTTKEIDDWTFQTFWWMPDAHDAKFGADRPASVKAPFDHYLMCTAYSTMSPRESDGGPPICFNPYLETDLGATKPYVVDGKTYPPDPMAGTRSNCMNCHRRAGFPAFAAGDPGAADFGHVYNDGYRSPDDSYFARLVKTDFMWSIALKNVMPAAGR